MVTELNFVNHNNERFTSFEYDYHLNFVLSGFSKLIYDQSNFRLRFTDSVFLITLGMIIPSVIVYFASLKEKIRFGLSNVLATLVIAVLMTLPLSLPIWENVSVLQKTQFPWRWLAVISMCGAIFAAAGFKLLFEYFPTNKRPLVILTAGLMIAGFAFTFIRVMQPLIQNPKKDFNQIVERLKTSRSNDAWWTIWATGEAIRGSGVISINDRQFELISSRPTEKVIKFSEGATVKARLNIFYYPHWKAFAGDREIEVGRNEDGSMLLYLPAEEIEVKIIFVEPSFVRVAYHLSFLAWILFFLSAGFLSLKNFKSPQLSNID
jgi:hypothetical protein